MAKQKRTIRHSEIVRIFAERLRGTRQARGMTQRDLANKAHVTFSYVSRLEAGGAAPGIDLLERLAGALNVNAVDLLPTPAMPESITARREQVRDQLEIVLKVAGQETLSMLSLFLGKLAESRAINR